MQRSPDNSRFHVAEREEKSVFQRLAGMTVFQMGPTPLHPRPTDTTRTSSR